MTECYKEKKATNDPENLSEDDLDFNSSYLNNDDESFYSRAIDIAILAKQNQSITLPGHIVVWKYHLTHDCITPCLILPSGCSPDDIGTVIHLGGKEVVITQLWPRVMMNPMALHEMYPGACGTKQYSEGHVKTATFEHRMSVTSMT